MHCAVVHLLNAHTGKAAVLLGRHPGLAGKPPRQTQGQALAEDDRVLLVMLSRTINPIMVWRGQLAWRGVLSHTVATGLGGGEFLA